MAQGEILYLSSVGGFRKRKVTLDPTHPIIVKNSRDGQAHALDERPVHSILPSVYFDSIEELLLADAPKDPVRVEKWGIVCPDNAVWPLSAQGLASSLVMPTRDPDEEGDITEPIANLDALRELKYQEYVEEATQGAVYQGSKLDHKDGYLTAVSFTLGITACAVIILIAAVLAWTKWGNPAPEVIPAQATASLLLFLAPLLGLVRSPENIFRSRERRGKAPRISVPPRIRRIKPIKGDAYVNAMVFDHALLGGKIWRARMLYSVWMAILPESCVFRPDIPKFRKLGAFIGAVVLGGIVLAFGVQFIDIIIGAILGLPGLLIGAGLGWVFGPIILGTKPIIMVARVPDDNNTRKLVPIQHNYCRIVGPGEYLDSLEASLERLNSASGDDDDYEPTIFRATTFYDDLRCQDETAEMTAPSDTLKKVQIGVMAAMAFGSIGLLFFIVLATTPGG